MHVSTADKQGNFQALGTYGVNPSITTLHDQLLYKPTVSWRQPASLRLSSLTNIYHGRQTSQPSQATVLVFLLLSVPASRNRHNASHLCTSHRRRRPLRPCHSHNSMHGFRQPLRVFDRWGFLLRPVSLPLPMCQPSVRCGMEMPKRVQTGRNFRLRDLFLVSGIGPERLNTQNSGAARMISGIGFG
jgi:hypothetical protein